MPSQLKRFLKKNNKKCQHHKMMMDWPETKSEMECSGVMPSVIEFQGKCSVRLCNIDLSATSINNTVVGAWFGGEMAVCRCDREGNFSLKVKVPSNPSEVLKVSSYLDITDPETGLRKMFPMHCCGFHMEKLASNNVVQTCTDPFNEHLQSDISIQCMTSGIPLNKFARSSLRDIGAFDEGVKAMSEKIQAKLLKNNLRTSKPGMPFMEGLTFLPFGGMPSCGIPALNTHYALFGAMMDGLDRTYPQTFACYYLGLALAQSQHTLDDLQAMMDSGCRSRAYMNMVADTIMGFTKDALILPYQRDAAPAFNFSFDQSQMSCTIGLETTEDINMIGYEAALMTECDVDLSACPLPNVSEKSSLEEMRREFHSQDWPKMSRSLGKDDCETSAEEGKKISKTIEKCDWSVSTLKRVLQCHPVFSDLTEKDYQVMSRFFTIIKQKLVLNEMQVTSVVGLAGGASANNVQDTNTNADDIDNETDLGGHCFAVLKMYDSKTQTVNVRILEGTNSVLLLDKEDIVEYKVDINDNGKIIEKAVDSCTFATALGNYMCNAFQVCNARLGFPETTPVGWQGASNNECLIRAQMALNAKDPVFYKEGEFVGKCWDVSKYGYIPCSLRTLPDKMLKAGCSAVELCEERLQGITIDEEMLERGLFEIGVRCFNEIIPPCAKEETLHKVLNSWQKMQSLESINRDLPKQKGVQYMVVNSMESPMSPLLVDLLYHSKKKLCDLANTMNMEDPQSDHAFYVVRREGTGVTVSAFMPIAPCKITLVKNTDKALSSLRFGLAKCSKK